MSNKDKDLEKILKALANKRRIAIVRCLSRRSVMNVSAIAEEIKLSFKATSRHLSILRAAGIVDKNQQGLEMLYALEGSVPTMARVIISNL